MFTAATSQPAARPVVVGAAVEIAGLRFNPGDIHPFDVYTGVNIDSGRKSVALGLILQEKSHTLTDLEVDEVIKSVLDRLSDDFDAKLRD